MVLEKRFMVHMICTAAQTAPKFPGFSVGCIRDKKCLKSRTGIFYATSVLGPAMGFILGGYFLSLYTDTSVDPSTLGMSRVSVGWIGRWWFGFFIASIVAFTIAGPVSSFPKELPGKQEKEQLTRKKSIEELPQQQPQQQQPVVDRSFVSYLRRLLTNKFFLTLTFAACAETFIASGLTGFATKIFISMFGVSSSAASGLLGAVSIPSACGGTLLGGYIVTKLAVKSSTITRYCFVLSLIPWFTIFVFMHSCPNINYGAGNTTVVHMWAENQRQPLRVRDLNQSCNHHCKCTGFKFDPVCGSDGISYFSPCVAGCASARQVNNTQIYMQCSCINGPILQWGEKNDTSLLYQAARDPCPSTCGLVAIFCIAIFIALFCTFLLIVPALTVMLRTLDEDLKSTGIGVNYVAVRLFGTIPGPICFGYLIDKSCILWQDTCEGRGACAIYENSLLGYNIFRLMIAAKTASIIFFFLSALSIRDSPESQGQNAVVVPANITPPLNAPISAVEGGDPGTVDSDKLSPPPDEPEAGEAEAGEAEAGEAEAGEAEEVDKEDSQKADERKHSDSREAKI